MKYKLFVGIPVRNIKDINLRTVSEKTNGTECLILSTIGRTGFATYNHVKIRQTEVPDQSIFHNRVELLQEFLKSDCSHYMPWDCGDIMINDCKHLFDQVDKRNELGIHKFNFKWGEYECYHLTHVTNNVYRDFDSVPVLFNVVYGIYSRELIQKYVNWVTKLKNFDSIRMVVAEDALEMCHHYLNATYYYQGEEIEFINDGNSTSYSGKKLFEKYKDIDNSIKIFEELLENSHKLNKIPEKLRIRILLKSKAFVYKHMYQKFLEVFPDKNF